MDRAEFTRIFLDQINFVIRSTQRSTEKRIEARQSRVDSASFQKWLIDERDKVLSIPAFGPFDQVNRKHMGTPQEAAETVAQWVDFYFDGVVDWGEMWGHFLSILRGIYDYPHGIDRNLFLSTMLYRKVVEAETIAASLSSASETIAPSFQSLFLSDESMERALAAAEKVGMVRRNGEVIIWAKQWQIGAIVFFWEHLQIMNPPMVDFKIDTRVATKVIAERFGETIADRTNRGTPMYRDRFILAIKAAL